MSMKVLTNLAIFLTGLCAGMLFSIPPDLIGLAALGAAVFVALALVFQIAAIWAERL
jgi:hypothetical protein